MENILIQGKKKNKNKKQTDTDFSENALAKSKNCLFQMYLAETQIANVSGR